MLQSLQLCDIVLLPEVPSFHSCLEQIVVFLKVCLGYLPDTSDAYTTLRTGGPLHFVLDRIGLAQAVVLLVLVRDTRVAHYRVRDLPGLQWLMRWLRKRAPVLPH